ncbi:serine/threonine protein kinase [filamentous cyanobacterium CCP3]|nr:serine/threonine protein kinase [filamentous cyanobacterium CCP3]
MGLAEDATAAFAEAELRIQEALESDATELDLSGLGLTVIPESLGNLTSLNWLDLSDNQLTAIPDYLGNLPNLTRLYLYQNQLTVIPDYLGNLVNLTELSLYRNQLISIPDSLGNLTNLTVLDLDQNQLTAIPDSLGNLANLKVLYLHKNEKLGLPVEVLGPTWREVAEGATAANPHDILSYYFRLLSERIPLNEAKMILVGFGAVGKTSLTNRLIYQNFDPQSAKTEGIQITQWPIHLNGSENITLHVWDFGGQEIMHSTHQFFLTERSLYLLVLNGRQGHEDADAEYWLELIQSFGGDSPIIVVLNKIKEHPFDVNRGALQQKFLNIREFIATDCETSQGIDYLRTAIERETDVLEHLRDPFPASWVAIKNKLSEMADNYISFEHYRAICQTDGETDYGAQDSLAVHLHSLGIALNYKDDPRLRDTHVLNPHWVTNGIYTLLNADELAHTKGELEAACLSRNLDAQNYPAERHGFLLELMRKFELCFRFQDDEHRYLIPDLLDKQQPTAAAEFAPAECLNFRYQYPILPEGLLPRFIVRTHVLSEHQLRWRTGVILNFEGNRALVKADPQDRCVSISVDGPMNSRRRLLAVIRSDFERIHRNFKFKPKELVPVPGHPDVAVDYKELLMREEHRQTSFDVFTGSGLLTLTVRNLLNGVDLEGTRRPTTAMERHSQALRLFFSYSHKDDLLREQLETHLKLLQRQGLIQPWHDRRILPGDDWAGEIDDNLNRADIILLLVSADFMASDYCYDIEMKRAMERHESGEARVIPIILRPVDWRGTPFNKLSWLPQNGEPVVQWENRDAAWLNVETGIKRVVESIRGDKRL